MPEVTAWFYSITFFFLLPQYFPLKLNKVIGKLGEYLGTELLKAFISHSHLLDSIYSSKFVYWNQEPLRLFTQNLLFFNERLPLWPRLEMEKGELQVFLRYLHFIINIKFHSLRQAVMNKPLCFSKEPEDSLRT